MKDVHAADPTWDPPKAPEDILAGSPIDQPTDWPRWVTSPGGYPLGSAWVLTHRATIVAPRHLAYATLALTRNETTSRYSIDEGTRLTLVKTYDPETDPSMIGLAMALYYEYFDGWAKRTYRVVDGQAAGTLLHFSADRIGSRFPISSRIAHAAIVPAESVVSSAWLGASDTLSQGQGATRSSED